MQKAESSYRLQGRKEGRIEGRMEGRMEGRIEEKFEIARNLLCLGTVSIEDILRVTQISKEDLTALQAQKPVEFALSAPMMKRKQAFTGLYRKARIS